MWPKTKNCFDIKMSDFRMIMEVSYNNMLSTFPYCLLLCGAAGISVNRPRKNSGLMKWKEKVSCFKLIGK